jgi:hypothetical protein
LDLTANPVVGGSTDGAGDYQYGDSTYLTAIPNSGYSFVNWTKDGKEISTDPVISYKITDNEEVVANFGIISDVDRHTIEVIPIHPNPASDFIQLSGFIGEVKIVHANGSVVRTLDAKDETEVSITDLDPGVYFVHGLGRIGRFVVSK